tara:strand:- start:259 stop:792 length:534 start_codon:yes stop_codon:yes gene_type:complete
MSEESSDWMGALTRPSKVISVSALALGTWALMLTVINITIGAYSEGRKVMWIDFFTNGAKTNIGWEFGIAVDDVVFAFISLAFIGTGYWMMGGAVEGGAIAWLRGLRNESFFTSLISTDGGLTRTMASWSVLVGVFFYFSWSILHNTWVDPGVYSVMISFVSIGLALHVLQGFGATH